MHNKSIRILFLSLLITTTINTMDLPIHADKKPFVETAMSAVSNAVTGLGGMIKRNWVGELKLDVSQEARQTIEKLAVAEGGIGIRLVMQPETNKALDQTSQAIKQTSESFKALTEKYHPEKGLIFTIETGENIKKLATDGVKAHIFIDPATIKTLCFSTTGAALAMAGIGLILYESFFVEDYATETPKAANWSASVKNFIKNRYVLGSASIAAGLCLIAKSTTL